MHCCAQNSNRPPLSPSDRIDNTLVLLHYYQLHQHFPMHFFVQRSRTLTLNQTKKPFSDVKNLFRPSAQISLMYLEQSIEAKVKPTLQCSQQL